MEQPPLQEKKQKKVFDSDVFDISFQGEENMECLVIPDIGEIMDEIQKDETTMQPNEIRQAIISTINQM